MGNHKTRKEIAEQLRALGLPLYKGRKFAAYRHLNLNHLKFILSLTVGSIVNDCDFYNHKVKEKPTRFRLIRLLHCKIASFDDQVLFDDGLSCGCPN